MADEQAQRDSNYVVVALVEEETTGDLKNLKINPSTGRVKATVTKV
jgi:hypothetical protein|tara:strand:+ start:41 stop:178 length:138 start_codon:yes stop_codon:yes gene_type:complete